MAREISLTQGSVSIVDDNDYDALSQYKWHVLRSKGLVYATRKIITNESMGKRRTSIPMQRDIMNPPKGMVVDHIDGNGLNNQRNNLRICSYSQNIFSRHRHTPGYTGCRGIYLSSAGTFVVKIGHNGRRLYLGSFKTISEAETVFREAAKELYGEFSATSDGFLRLRR